MPENNNSEKRMISPGQFDWLKRELSRFEQTGLITSEQVQSILSSYKVKGKTGFIRILLMIGSILIGVGILSFIAGNWNVLSKTAKFSLILFGLAGAYVSGWKMEKDFPKTSRSLYYIGLAIFGAGIFLIGQMFHQSSEPQQAFLAWLCGAVPLSLYLKDHWVFIFSIVLTGIYASSIWDSYHSYPYLVWALIPFFYWINECWLQKSRNVFFLNNTLLIFSLWATFIRLDWHGGIIALIFLLIGTGFVFLPISHYANVLEYQGSLIHGIAFIALTLPDLWKVWETVFHVPSLGFFLAVGYLLFLFFLLKKGSLSAVIISVALIFRFYIDLSVDFLPKSLYFLIGGILLIAGGFWIEKSRKGGRNR
ncbi:MAG: DUF2157 domain-containing protein [Thermoactinomyces sp.]